MNQRLYNILPNHVRKLFDSDFDGIEKDCPKMKKIVKPVKRKKGRDLSCTKRLRNYRISRKRVNIENAFAGVKRFRITWDVLRGIKANFSDSVFRVSCGLWYFHLSACFI
ncbi:DDE family endonuclease domain protein [Leptospira weilii serovar Topaz str. LT2116]|uniref:DDE family endonuclease domain protein n=1 Tax=Leptospira weilii serovar Topaz str. LT2116 TaxID=1088540 RepID=M3GU12_9LEPT|nr:DDE family endonuclease domain protein [Leptospira weilii serovar Topaz str. LT2116]